MARSALDVPCRVERRIRRQLQHPHADSECSRAHSCIGGGCIGELGLRIGCQLAKLTRNSYDLVCVAWIGRIAALLQGSGKANNIAARAKRVLVTRVVADQGCIVLEAVCDRAVSAKAFCLAYGNAFLELDRRHTYAL